MPLSKMVVDQGVDKQDGNEIYQRLHSILIKVSQVSWFSLTQDTVSEQTRRKKPSG